jgi:mannan endo-1,4-beta-mannosidase
MKTRFTNLYVFFTILLLPMQQVFAQKYEAENATLSGGATIVNNTLASGGKHVETREGDLIFSVNIPKTGFYNIYVNASAPNGDKTNTISIGDANSDFALASTTEYENLKVVSTYKLTAGQHTIKIIKSWGWINVDYIQLEEVDPANRFDINQTLVTPNPTAEAVALYQFLLDNYEKKIISGVMTLNSFDESDWLKQNTGKEPALLGIDYMHSNRGYTWYNDQTPTNDALAWYNKNGIPAIMWHWRDPSRLTEDFYVPGANSGAAGTNFDITKIFEPNSAEYKAMIADIDFMANSLKTLQDEKVAVLWRPIHEAAGTWFWWGAKGPEPCKELYKVMFDRMVNHHGLRNLIWVWTREANDDDWYPGDEYVDIIGRDIYANGDHGSQIIEFNRLNDLHGGKKMIALAEVGSFPDVDNLIADAAAWSWYMPWYGGFTRDEAHNSLALWQKMFASDYVITLDEMPNLRTYATVTSTAPVFNTENTMFAYPSPVLNDVLIKSKNTINSISIYNALGERVLERSSNSDEVLVNMTGFKAGIYFIKVNGTETIKVIKE